MTDSESKFNEIHSKIASFYNIESNDIKLILENVAVINPDLHKILKEYSILLESYHFIKTDRMLMLKARDIWITELKVISISMEECAVYALELIKL